MLRLPESPRKRRRLLRAAAVLAVAGLVGIVVAVFPGHHPPPASPNGSEGPARMAVATHLRVTAAQRRAIDRLLDRFLPAALERRDPTLAWRLAGPELKAGSTLADWRSDDSPVPYYPARETSFDAWHAVDVERGSVIFNLVLHPRTSRLGSWAFSGEVIEVHGRWLVNRFYTIATFDSSTARVVGPADFGAQPAGGGGAAPTTQHARAVGLLPILGILGLVLLLPLSLGAVALVRARRFRRGSRALGSTALPPLPPGFGGGGEAPH